MKLKKILARNLLALRNAHGYSNSEIAARARAMHLKLSASAVNYMMRDDGREPTIGSLEAVAAVFHVRPEALLDQNFDLSNKTVNELTPEVIRIAKHVRANLSTLRTILNPALMEPEHPPDVLVTTQDLLIQSPEADYSLERKTQKKRPARK